MDYLIWLPILERLDKSELLIMRRTNKQNRYLVSRIFFIRKHGQLKFIQDSQNSAALLLQLSLIDFDQKSATKCVYNNWIEALDYLWLLNIKPFFDDYWWVSQINKNFVLIKWFIDKMNIRPTQRDIDKFANIDLWEEIEKYGQLPTSAAYESVILKEDKVAFKWLLAKDILPTDAILNRTLSEGQLGFLKWLKSEFCWLPQKDQINSAVWSDSVDLLDWLAQFDLLPDRNGANLALKANKEFSFNWLISKQIFPTEEGLNLATMNIKNIELIKKCVEIGINLTESEILRIILQGKLEDVKWVMQIWGERPKENWTDLVVNQCDISILKWFEEKGWLNLAYQN